MTDPAITTPAAPAAPKPSWVYRVIFALAAIVAAVFVVFFLIGIADGSVSSFNIVLWIGTLAVVGAIVIGGHALRAHGHTRIAIALLAVLAVPRFFYGLLMLLVIASGARWN